MNRKPKFIIVMLCTIALLVALPLESFADNMFSKDYEMAWENLSYVVGQEYAETGATCPKCGASLRKIDQGTCPSCGYNALIVDEDGKITYKTGGGSAGTSGVGRPKAYKEDNTPTVTSSGLYTMYVHPTFIRSSTGSPYVSGTQNSLNNGVIQENTFFTTTLETNRVSVSYSSSDGSTFQIDSKVYYKITAPVTGHYEFKDWNYKDVKCGGVFDSLDKTLSIKLGEINLSKGNTEETLYFHAISDKISNGQFTYLYAPDLVVKYTPFNERTNSYQPLEKKTSITANGKEVTGTIYHDPENNYYYAYDDNDNCTVYVQNKKGDVIGDISYDQTENIYITNIYPGATTGEDETDESPDILTILIQIRDNMIQGFADLKATLVQGWADLSANFTLAIENLNVNIQNTFNKKFPDLPEPTPEPALPAPVEPSTGDKWSDDIVSGTSISGTVNAKAGDYVLATVSARSALTIPDSMTYLYKGNVFASNDVNQSMSFAYQKIAEDGTYTYTFKQATAGRMYLSLIVLSDIDGLSYSGKYHIEVKSKTPVSVPEKSDGDMLVWGCSSTAWLTSDTSNSKSWITNPDDLTYIGGASNSGQSRQANFIDLGTGAVSRTFFPYENSGDNLFFVVDAVEIIPKTITPSPSPSPSPTPDHGTDPTPAPTDKPSGGNTNNFWNFVFPGGNDDGTENGHKGILWALISLLIAVVTFVLSLGSAYSYVFPFLPAGLVTTIHICVLVLLLFAIIKFVRSFL